MTISIPLVAIAGVVVLVVWRYPGLKAWQALVCLLAGFLLAATSAVPLAVHPSRHDIADAIPGPAVTCLPASPPGRVSPTPSMRIEVINMIQVHTCVSVHCDQCGHILGLPERAWHFRTEGAAINAAMTDRWRIGSDGLWWCAVCAPVLICQAEGRHQFTPWRSPQIPGEHPAPSEYRYCRRCCVLEDRPVTAQGRDGGQPQ